MSKDDQQSSLTHSIGSEIFELASKISHADEETDMDSSIEELETIIFGCLTHADDESLIEATQIAVEKDDLLAFDEIKRAVEYESVAAEIDESTPENPVTAHLFAIPIVLDAPLSVFSSHLSNSEALRSLEKSIAASGIADGNPDIHLIDYLYSPEELEALSPSEIYNFTKIAHKERKKKRSHKLHQADLTLNEAPVISQSEVPGAARLDMNVVLKYLVGVFIDRTGVDPFETAYNSPEDSPENAHFNETLESWRSESTELIKLCVGPLLGNTKIAIGAVDTLYLALQFGESDYRQTLLILQMYEALASKQINPRSTRAMIVPYGSEGEVTEIRVTLVSLLDSSIAAGLVCEISALDDYDDVMNTISSLLATHGVFMSNIVNEIQSVQKTNRYQKNNFLTEHHDIASSWGLLESGTPRILH